jgi:hypothetical protein
MLNAKSFHHWSEYRCQSCNFAIELDDINWFKWFFGNHLMKLKPS